MHMVPIHFAFTKCSWDHLEGSKAWTTNGLDGARRFLDRIWRLLVNEDGTITAENVGTDDRVQA